MNKKQCTVVNVNLKLIIFLLTNISIDPDYVDETEIFYDDPVQWLEAHLPAHEGSSHLPSHLVMYETLAPVIELFLRSRKYTEVSTSDIVSGLCLLFIKSSPLQIARVFHTHIRDSERVGGNILIFRHDHA